MKTAGRSTPPRTAGWRVYNLYRGWLYRARDPLRGAAQHESAVFIDDAAIAQALTSSIRRDTSP